MKEVARMVGFEVVDVPENDHINKKRHASITEKFIVIAKQAQVLCLPGRNIDMMDGVSGRNEQ